MADGGERPAVNGSTPQPGGHGHFVLGHPAVSILNEARLFHFNNYVGYIGMMPPFYGQHHPSSLQPGVRQRQECLGVWIQLTEDELARPTGGLNVEG